MRLHLEVAVRRGEITEARHRLQCAIVDAEGRLAGGTDDPHAVTTFRSAAKPFQLLPLVERGHADRFGFGPEELAVMAASHTGTSRHVELVLGILARIGLGADRLACGYHDPDDPGSRDAIFRGSVERSPLYNNCSGKHAGLIALAVAEGWPVEGYQRADHPVQQLLHRTVAECCAVAPESMGTAVDGCGVVVFALPLSAMARGYATLAATAAGEGDDARSEALRRIALAMTRHPRIVEGSGRNSTALMEATRGRVLAKCGAEGLQLAGLIGRSMGVALKCEDGATRAVGPAIVALLRHLDALGEEELVALKDLRSPMVLNAAGLEVGSLVAELGVVAGS